MKKYKIGIDVGGTNTDCVLVNSENKIITKTKCNTTPDISTGIEWAMRQVLRESNIAPEEVNYIMLGTTHCTNAIVERKKLNKVGVIRICQPASGMIPPLFDFPTDLKATLGHHAYMVRGGFEFDGRPIHSIDESEIISVLEKMKGKVDGLAITGIFSKINPEQELKVAELVKKIIGTDITISLSHQIGGLGLLERENATMLNAALSHIARQMTTAFEEAVKKNGMKARLYFGQNDGTLMSIEHARQFPVLTIACGPTNSIRGAGALSGVDNAIVVDVGGTTSDAGVLINGFPRESNKVANIGGVKTNFRMPDIASIGLGGGTIVEIKNENLKIGPQSVGHRLKEEAMCFNGDTFTLSDDAILNEKIQIPETLPPDVIRKKVQRRTNIKISTLQQSIRQVIRHKIDSLTDKIKTDHKEIPLILVGGGSQILPDNIAGVSEIIRPHHYEVANAYGACIAKIGGEAEKIFNLADTSREEAIEQVKMQAVQNAVHAGANKETIEILTVSDVPLAYLPDATKLKVKVCGNIL